MSSDPNLVLRAIRKIDDDLQQFRAEANARFDGIETRLEALEYTVTGMTREVFLVSGFIRSIDRRVRKLETRPPK